MAHDIRGITRFPQLATLVNITTRIWLRPVRVHGSLGQHAVLLI